LRPPDCDPQGALTIIPLSILCHLIAATPEFSSKQTGISGLALRRVHNAPTFALRLLFAIA
jgi:hypothetical protein